MSEHPEVKPSLNFIEEIIEEDLRLGKNEGRVHTRFPPEPNGYLHIGHAKSICLNFGLAEKYHGLCNLRFDDTNPEKEEQQYIDAIKKDIQWLGFDWGDREFYASDYFQKLYELAVQLIASGKAYVDDQTAEEIAATRGTPTTPGTESPFRTRSVDENLALFEQMKAGEFEEGAKVLRAKIDMASPHTYLRDPVMYRIKYAEHPRTANQWCIYPTYDWAHGQSDALEEITHSICTLEFKVHRPLYEWYIETLGIFPSKQREFARLNLGYTVLSKRKLRQLVEEDYVNGWDDPRMPTLSGMRRRGYTAAAIRNFCDTIGIAKRDGIVDLALLEHSVRDNLNKTAPRVMGVLRPLKLVITNFPEGDIEICHAVNNPEDPEAGTREIPFTRELFIEKTDFMEEPPKKFFRLGPDREVRLKYAYIIKCESYDKDPETGEVTTVYGTYDPNTKSGSDTSGKKVKGTLSWVSATEGIDAELRLYDRLFTEENPDGDKEKDFKTFINPESLEVLTGSKVEPGLKTAKALDHFQFERQGYFNVDMDSTDTKLVFNRTVALRDNWAKMQKK
ncbi:glutamine--tRNA ligase/YqeY domain fusion protein [Fulvivirgaceae bacterium BMA12]|uniref:Glutamine--tRNA ligase n=1 Tax=Agaribacillus aureus TaxID=3051825 RepID=A0ABT8KYR0_9BACT|nr:glutamine--tRNA ligase/YqeY domain fusion protein [Fulvivirgaceae bacterium BMA12]